MPNYAGFETAPSGYNTNVRPQIGSGSVGEVPGQIGVPNSIYSELQSNVPNYASMTSGATGDIGSELSGRLSTGTQNLLQDKAAAFGVNSGMPGGAPGNTLTTQNFLNSLGLTSEGLAHQGLTDYNTFTGTAGSQQTDPNLAFGVASQNAVDAAAPNPAEAATYAQQLYDKYANPASNPATANNPAGGTGNYQPATGMGVKTGVLQEDPTENYAASAGQSSYYT